MNQQVLKEKSTTINLSSKRYNLCISIMISTIDLYSLLLLFKESRIVETSKFFPWKPNSYLTQQSHSTQIWKDIITCARHKYSTNMSTHGAIHLRIVQVDMWSNFGLTYTEEKWIIGETVNRTKPVTRLTVYRIFLFNET